MFIYVPFVAHMITLVTFVHIKAVDTSSVTTQVRFFGEKKQSLDDTLLIGKHIFM